MVRVYLNPKMVEWFNEWQSTPDLLGMDLENQQRWLDDTMDNFWNNLKIEKSFLENSEEQGLQSWLFFFMSLYEERWGEDEEIDYWGWLEREVLDGDKPQYGLNRDMVMEMVENYQSNFSEEFDRGAHMWWDWNFVFLDGDEVPTYPRLFGHSPRRKFGSIINWTTNPFEVKQ